MMAALRKTLMVMVSLTALLYTSRILLVPNLQLVDERVGWSHNTTYCAVLVTATAVWLVRWYLLVVEEAGRPRLQQAHVVSKQVQSHLYRICSQSPGIHALSVPVEDGVFASIFTVSASSEELSPACTRLLIKMPLTAWRQHFSLQWPVTAEPTSTRFAASDSILRRRMEQRREHAGAEWDIDSAVVAWIEISKLVSEQQEPAGASMASYGIAPLTGRTIPPGFVKAFLCINK